MVNPEDSRFGSTANSIRVDPEDFAHQVNYLAALGRLVVPRAFTFVGQRILFVGHEPFDAEELGNLLPDGVGWYEEQYAPEKYAADIVVLGRTFSKGLVKSVLNDIQGSPKIVPQEGFLDELLFGHDWWSASRSRRWSTATGVCKLPGHLVRCVRLAWACRSRPRRRGWSFALNQLHPNKQERTICHLGSPGQPLRSTGLARMLRSQGAHAILIWTCGLRAGFASSATTQTSLAQLAGVS